MRETSGVTSVVESGSVARCQRGYLKHLPVLFFFLDNTEPRNIGHTANPTYYDWEEASEFGATYSPQELPPIAQTDDNSGHTQVVASVVAGTAAPAAVATTSSASAAPENALSTGLTQVLQPLPSGQTAGVTAVQGAASSAVAGSALPPAADLETAQTLSTSAPAEVASADVAPPDDPVLNDIILALLSDAPRSDAAPGPPVHRDISLRWLEILSKGFKDEPTKTKIIVE